MPKKLTIEFIREEFKKQGYTLLSTKYIGCRYNLSYICPKQHEGTITWDNFKQGKRCAKCYGNKKHTIEFIKKEFEKEGYVLLTKKYINNIQKLDYICPKGHKGTIRWNDWQQGCRCAECGGNKKLTIEFIHKEFKKENYILLTKVYKNNYYKLKYVCPSGHYGGITWNSWQQGVRCAKCAGNKKLTIEFIREQFKKEDYILLTEKYKNCYQKLEYICPKKHECNITWLSWEKGKRCRKCWYEKNRGKNNCNYNPNLTKEERQYKRKYTEYYVWRIAVYDRDNYTCQVCLKHGTNLVAHHLESYGSNKKLRVVISNGVTLCKNCHKEFHRIYGRGNNTREQFEEFKKNKLWYVYCIS